MARPLIPSTGRLLALQNAVASRRAPMNRDPPPAAAAVAAASPPLPPPPWKLQIGHADFAPCRARRAPPLARASVLDQTHKERMAHNREQALRRLQKRQFTGKSYSEVAVSTMHCSVRSATNFPDSSNALHAKKESSMPWELTNRIQQDRSTLGGDVEQLSTVRATLVSETNHMVVGNSVNCGSQETLKPQDFDYVVVIDFEATCAKDMNALKPQEIIEFPAVIVDCRRLILGDSFHTYVKPVHHPILTEFCTSLTGISQEQVDKGVTLAEALYQHDKWLEEKGIKLTKFAILIWSDWDCKTMLESECKLKSLNKPLYFNRWINLKVLFQNAFNGRKCNLRKAVEASGLKWNGRAHCGLDDAFNTARLALELIRRGTNLTITGSLDPQPMVTKIRRPEWPVMLGHTDASDSLRDAASRTIDLANTGRDSKVCYCGVRCKRRLVKKPGPNCGKFFFACGRWTMVDGDQCGFFEWAGT